MDLFQQELLVVANMSHSGASKAALVCNTWRRVFSTHRCVRITSGNYQRLKIRPHAWICFPWHVKFCGDDITDSMLQYVTLCYGGIRAIRTVDLTGCKNLTFTGLEILVTGCLEIASVETTGCENLSPLDENKLRDRCNVTRIPRETGYPVGWRLRSTTRH
jgi:hypothetical protein